MNVLDVQLLDCSTMILKNYVSKKDERRDSI